MDSASAAEPLPACVPARRPATGDPPGLPALARPWGPGDLATATAAPDANHFGDRLVAAMQLRGNYKATALACALGVNEAAISRWKRGSPIKLEHAVRLCEALDVSMDWLIRGIGHPLQRPAGTAPLPPAISERTVDEVRALLRFVEHQSGRQLAQDASEPLLGARSS